MIQRIQSLYLLIVVILMSLLFFIPMSSFIWNGEIYKLYGWGLQATGDNSELIVNTLFMTILLSISVLLPLVTIFLYKKRMIQIRLCVVEIIMLVGMQLYVALYLYRSYSSLTSSESLVFSVVDVFPTVSLFLIFLAFRGIVKDETLVKSLNRIR